MFTVWYFRIYEHSPGIDQYVAFVIFKVCASLYRQEEKLTYFSGLCINSNKSASTYKVFSLFQILFSLMWAFLSSLILCQKTPQHCPTIFSLWKSIIGKLTSDSRIVSTWVDQKLPCGQTVDHPVIQAQKRMSTPWEFKALKIPGMCARGSGRGLVNTLTSLSSSWEMQNEYVSVLPISIYHYISYYI